MTTRQSAFFSFTRGQAPVASAHRAGNSVDAARHAHAARVDLLELDVWLSRGQLEVRHKARLGPLLREGWRLYPGWGPQLTLGELLERTPPRATLLIDLKTGRWGDHRDLGSRVVDLIETHHPSRRYALCGRNWLPFQAIEAHDVPVLFSAGDDSELAALWDVLAKREFPAASIQGALITPHVMARLRELGAISFAWTINTEMEAERLLALGVDGITSDNMVLLHRLKATET